MKIGILTAGGDCPGLNAAIRGVGKSAILQYGMEVYGFSDGFSGLIRNDFIRLTEENLSGILQLGGTILGTSREKPFKNKGWDDDYDISKPEMILANCEELGLDCVVCIGGNGTMKTAARLSEIGLNVIGLPKTIDNDVWGTDFTFGFDSALNIATEAVDRLHTTANSHKRTMVIEVMGHNTGWLALYTGVAGGADVILLPEMDVDMQVVADYLNERALKKKPYSIVVVAEGIMASERSKKQLSAASLVSRSILELTGRETRDSVLGYIQRGGTPSPMDRILATRFGTFASRMIYEKNYGNMVALYNNSIINVPLKECAGKLKMVPAEHSLIKKARRLGTCFGDQL